MESSLDVNDEVAPLATAAVPGTERAPRRKAAQWQDARVLDIIVETLDAVTLRLKLEESVDFLPGQYYNVRQLVAGRSGPIQRAYSIASSPLPDPSIIDIGVREVPGGLVSPLLVRDLSPGDRIEVRGPVGRFTWTSDDGGPVLLVGAGSGVVPLMSVIRYGVAANLEIPMRLVCSFASFDYAFYYAELTELALRYPWLEVIVSFTRDDIDLRATHHRRIDSVMIAEAVADQLPRRTYICGPPAMVEGVKGWLIELGISPSGIHTEKYD